MINNKNGKSPFADQEYLRSSSSANNKSKAFREKVTEADINEFEKVFDDDSDMKIYEGKGLFSVLKTKLEDHDHKKAAAHTPKVQQVRSAPAEKAAESPTEKTAPAPAASKEELYADLHIDIDAFLASLGTSGNQEKKTAASLSQKPAHTQAPVIKKSTAVHDGEKEATKSFSVNTQQKKEPDITLPDRAKSFRLDDTAVTRIKAASPSQSNVDIKNNVRVLSEDKQEDEPIFETAPIGDAKGSVLDSLTPAKGEDIFVAVDKAVKKKKNILSQSLSHEKEDQEKKKTRKPKKEKPALTGKELFAHLSKVNSIQKIQLIIALAVLLISFIVTILPSFYTPGNALTALFSGGFRVYAVINMALLAVIVAVFFKNYFHAVRSIAEMKPDSNTVLLIITIFVFVHQLAALFGSAMLTSPSNYVLVVAFTAFMKSVADYFRSSTSLVSLRTIMKGGSLQSIQPVESKADADTLANGITEKGNPRILYCAKADNVSGITAEIGEKHGESRFYVVSSIIVLLIGFITSLIVYFSTSDNNFFMTVLCSFVCLCSPVMKDTVSTINIYIQNLRLSKLGAAATSYEDIQSVGKANGIAMDVSDIFTCNVSSFRVFNGVPVSQNQAALYASAVTMGAGSLMGRCFKDFVKQMSLKLPVTEDLQYEERLGFSAWVDGKKVLLGNRDMLIQHSVPAPSVEQEKKHAGKSFVMYLVVEGRLTASFLVNYKVLSDIRKMSGEFNKTGLVLMLTSKDPCLTHTEIAKRLGIDMAGVKVLSQKGSDIITEYRKNKTMHAPSSLVCARKSRSILRLILGAHNIYTSDKLISDFHILGQSAGILLLLLSLLLNMPLFRNPFAIILLHTFWATGSYLISSGEIKITKGGLKNVKHHKG